MAINWENIFSEFGTKKVTSTDKSKKAYLPTEEQRNAILKAGLTPGTERPYPTFKVKILFDDSIEEVEASYYLSQRSKDANRPPEARMGKQFIRSWLNIGDRVLIGRINNEIFAFKIESSPDNENTVNSILSLRADPMTVIERAKASSGKPTKRVAQVNDFNRNPYVVEAAILRSKGKCEIPSCSQTLFKKDDGKNYLEVHHIKPLSEGGDDTLKNVAALCPSCHRMLHYGESREDATKELEKLIPKIKI